MGLSVPEHVPAQRDSEEASRPAALLGKLERLTGRACGRCPRPLCGHAVLFSVLMGHEDVPRCLECLAGGLGRASAELRDEMAEYLWHRDCYRQAWDVASDREGVPRGRHPRCLWPAGSTPPAAAIPPAERPADDESAVAASWDAGDMGCGELVLALRIRLNALPAGTVLRVTARDPAAPLDLPAWCRLTGHRLLRANHPTYDIRRKEP